MQEDDRNMRRAERLIQALESVGVDRVLRPWLAGRGAVFVLHRIAAEGSHLLDPDMTATTDLLDAALSLVRREGYECISLDEVPSRLRSSGSERFAVFTFDDGYRDNVTMALPIFRAHRAPFGLYVATGLIDRTITYWWGALASLVAASERLELHRLGLAETVTIDSWPEKQVLFGRLQHWVHENLEPRSRIILEWCGENGIEGPAVLNEDALTWDELRSLAQDPLVTIGAHGITHSRLARLDEAAVFQELSESRARLELQLGRPIRHFAYPYGGPDACGPREFGMTASAGYLTAVTTRRGNLFAAHANHLTALPRRRLTEGEPSLRTVRRGLSGIEWFFRRGSLVVTT